MTAEGRESAGGGLQRGESECDKKEHQESKEETDLDNLQLLCTDAPMKPCLIHGSHIYCH